MNAERLADWQALCDYLETRPYNAAYEPRCKGVYLLAGPVPATKFILVDDLDQEPRTFAGRTHYPKKQILNPNYAAERERAKFYRQIVKERRAIGLVFWSSGYGWRLHKGYKEMLEQLRAGLDDEH